MLKIFFTMLGQYSVFIEFNLLGCQGPGFSPDLFKIHTKIHTIFHIHSFIKRLYAFVSMCAMRMMTMYVYTYLYTNAHLS